MKRITFTFVCGLLLASFSIRSTQAQTDSTFKPSGKFFAQFFGDYYYKLHADSLGRGSGQYSGVPKDFSNFELRRVYLGYNYDISKTFTTEFLLAYETGTTDVQGERSFYLKLANIQWKNIYSNATLVFGAQATPSYPMSSEAVWGYRSVEKTILDKNKIASSSDLGLGLRGSFDDEKNFGYDVLYADGTAQKLETDRYKKLYADVWAKFMDKKIIINVYGDLERKSEVPADNSTIKFFAAYNTKPLTVGVEVFFRTNGNAAFDTIAKANIDTKPFGLSIFATGDIIEKTLSFFARYDMVDPDNSFKETGIGYQPAYFKGNSTAKENFIVAGLDWTPYANVHIMPNFWYTGYSSKLANASGLVKSDNDIVPRLTVFYKF